MDNSKTYQHLAPRADSHYRQLFFKGTRIRAEIIYSLTVPSEDGEVYTPEQAAEAYGLPLEAVQEAIDYCRTHPPEIALDHAREELLCEMTGMNHPEYKYNPKKYYRMLSPEERARLEHDASLPR